MNFSILIFLGISIALIAVMRKNRARAALLIAGAIAGPHALGLYQVSGVWNYLAGLGMIFLWFGLGLELNVRRLWSMRRAIFGLGAAEVLCVAALLFPLIFGFTEWTVMGAVMTCLILAMSNSGADLQTLADRNELSTKLGRQTFSILLFQNLLAVPLLAMLPVFAQKSLNLGAEIIDVSMLTIALIAGVVIVSRLFLNPLIKRVSKIRSREAFLLAVLIVISLCETAAHFVHLPIGVGAFLAGMMFSESLYNHQIRSDMSPYQLLFAALFFITLGMGLDIPFLGRHWALILGGTALFMAVKFAAVYLSARIRRANQGGAFLMALVLAQGGEFGLLVLQTLKISGIEAIPARHAEILTAVILASMIISPSLVRLYDRITGKGGVYSAKKAREFNALAPARAPAVVICGFGRVGRTIARMLAAQKIPYVAIDMSADGVAGGQAAGYDVFYGDTTRPDVLSGFGLGPRTTKAAILALDNASVAKNTARAIRRIAPRVKIFARARNLHESKILVGEGVKLALPETIESSFMLGRGVLAELGVGDRSIAGIMARMRRDNYKEIG